MEAVAHHVLLAGAAAALVATALRLASTLTPRGLERAVAAAPLAAAMAVLWSLALGLAELGTNRVALAGAAAAGWLAARRLVPAPQVSLATDLTGWWDDTGRAGRVAAGAAAAALAAYAGFLLRHPQLGTDSVIYHLPDVVAWIGNGRPGSVVDLLYALPVGNYPQANETVLTWGSALSRSFVFAGLWSLATLVLLLASGWVGLRAARVDRLFAALGLAAVCTAPLVVEAARTPGTDLPALAWLVTTGALVAASSRRPALLAPALVAAGLGIGTKTTVAPLALAVLAAGFWMQSARLSEHRRPLVLAGFAAAVVGGVWYARNLIGHGSPLWPLVELPGSDPVPDLVDRLDYSLLDRPEKTLRGNLGEYERRLAGYLLLLAAALAAPLFARRRAVTVAAVAAGLSVLLWLNAPFTGAADSTLDRPFLSTVRYLLPAAAAAALCLCLAGKGAGRLFALFALGLSIAWNLLRTLDLGYPVTPSAFSLLAAAAAGAALAAFASARLVRWGGLASLGVFVIAGAAATDGYIARHARANGAATRVPYTVVAGALAARPDFRDGSDRVSMAPGVSAMLAGDTFEHEVVLIPRDEPCSKVEARARGGWVVIADVEADSVPSYTARDCFSGRPPLFESGAYRVYRD